MNSNLNIKKVFEDEEILVLDKGSGVVVNRANTVVDNTVQDWLGDYFKLGEDLGIGDRAGIVHRLDRETSGLLLVAKSQRSFEKLQEQFAQRIVKKEYAVLVHGKFDEVNTVVDKPIGRVGSFGRFGTLSKEGREAVTYFRIEKDYLLKKDLFEDLTEDLNKNKKSYLKNHGRVYTLLTALPQTGRTHQIRVHLKSLGAPVVSDLIYGPSKLLKFDLKWCARLFLHAQRIEFKHPKSGKYVSFESPLPVDLKSALGKLTTKINQE